MVKAQNNDINRHIIIIPRVKVSGVRSLYDVNCLAHRVLLVVILMQPVSPGA